MADPGSHPLAADLIVANAPDPVFVSDLEGKILETNEAVSELLGLRRDEVLEQSISRFLNPGERREFVLAVREVVERGVTRNVRLNPSTASGEVIATTLNASALRDQSGKVIGVIGILRDMRELDKARAYAESLIKNAPDPVFVADLEGKVLQANDAVFALLGFRPDELVEQSLSRIISADETREFIATLREVVERGVSRNARFHPRTVSGEVIPTALNASALRDAAGKVIGAIGILRDMRELDKARAYAESLIKNAPDPVFVSDLQGKILQANDAVSELLGFRQDEVVEQSVARFITADETREFVAALREVVARGVTRNVRLTPRSATGDIIPTNLNASALRDTDGKVIGAIGMLRDMRAYEQVVDDLEESRRDLGAANRAKDQFLAMVSHELRTPLTSMLAWARLLRARTLDETAGLKGLEVIERNTSLLAQLIEDLLDVSRIVNGKFRLETRPLDPATPLEAAVEAVQALADAKGIRLKAELERSAAPVMADAARLQQVVWNLLSNAIKFTPPHGRVDLRLCRVDGMVRITVRDTGTGIDQQLLPHIFERFRQGDSTHASGGLGLGLAIARHIVELHGGAIRAESDGDGRGATFTVELPVMTDGAEIATGTVAQRRPDGRPLSALTSLGGLRVLIVEDEADAQEILTMIMRHAGADVQAAASVREAVDILERWTPDVLVSDIGLPDERGYALIRRVRAGEAEHGRSLPALAVTAYASAEDRRQALAAGFQGHLAKPIDPAELTARISALVAERRDGSTSATPWRRLL